MKTYDVIIIGGGLVGLSLAAILSKTNLKIAIIESRSFTFSQEKPFDERVIALSPSSLAIFKALGLEETIVSESTQINQIHVSDQGHIGRTLLTKADTDGNSLGFVIASMTLQRLLYEFIAASTIDIIPSTNVVELVPGPQPVLTLDKGTCLQAQIVVAADGQDSLIRKVYGVEAKIKDYGQTAIVTTIGLDRSHQGIAYERFTPQGPLALLPLSGERSGLVWSVDNFYLPTLLNSSDEDFLKHLQSAFGYRLGRFLKVGSRSVYPLKMILSRDLIKPATVFLGNAQHVLHPIAGQGFNLSLRDVAVLAQLLQEAHLSKQPLGSFSLLSAYEKHRKTDQMKTALFCDFVPQVFIPSFLPLVLARDLGLSAVERIPVLKKLFLKQNQGYGGCSADLISGISLQKKGCTDGI